MTGPKGRDSWPGWLAVGWSVAPCTEPLEGVVRGGGAGSGGVGGRGAGW